MVKFQINLILVPVTASTNFFYINLLVFSLFTSDSRKSGIYINNRGLHGKVKKSYVPIIYFFTLQWC